MRLLTLVSLALACLAVDARKSHARHPAVLAPHRAVVKGAKPVPQAALVRRSTVDCTDVGVTSSSSRSVAPSSLVLQASSSHAVSSASSSRSVSSSPYSASSNAGAASSSTPSSTRGTSSTPSSRIPVSSTGTSSSRAPTSSAVRQGAPCSFDHIGGQATFYDMDDGAPYPGAPGACGYINKNEEKVVAIPEAFFNQRMCGKSVYIKNNKTGQTLSAKIVDSCATCYDYGDLDLSKGAMYSFYGGSAQKAEEEGQFPVSYCMY